MNSKEKIYYDLIRSGDFEGLKSVFQNDSDACNVMPYGQSLPMHAVFENKMDILKFLIKRGCDLNKGDDDGLTPLHAAALENNREAAAALLRGGAEPDIEDRFGNTPLFRAVYSYEGDPSVISLLLQQGADPFHKNKAGVSPYELAEKKEEKDLVRSFNDRGVN
ncbi:MAG TPA: ankyrin repeat domain-containing protein [Blastocatellia bacterium]|nr:ankyrin repeat domain-containing protein [Blastocatellia bacterium]